jgi:hypothetical protein
MSQELRYFTDEDIYGAVATALRKSGVDAVSTPEAGRLAETDESQLQRPRPRRPRTRNL